MKHSTARVPLPAQPFFSTPEQRLALARDRFFEEGVRPSGLLSELVIQSWSRCLQARRDPNEAIAFNAVTESRIHSALARSRLLRETAASELKALESTLSGTACTVLLTDPHGVVVHVARSGSCAGETILPLAGRVGVNLGEECVGTNAPGLTAKTGQACLVLGGEHYFRCVQAVHCAAAPIRDVHGQLAGVLDISSESRPFGFDAAAVVGQFATAIENRLLQAQSSEHIVVHLQTAPALFDTPMGGLAGITSDGRIAWANGVAAKLLGISSFGCALGTEDVFSLRLAELAALTGQNEARQHRLASGLSVWLRATMQAPDGAARVVKVGTAANGRASVRSA